MGEMFVYYIIYIYIIKIIKNLCSLSQFTIQNKKSVMKITDIIKFEMISTTSLEVCLVFVILYQQTSFSKTSLSKTIHM